jgi:hypothetical protein
MKVNFLIESIAPAGTYFRSHNLAIALSKIGADVRVFGIDYTRPNAERVESRDGIRYHIVPSCRGQRLFGQHHHPLVAVLQSMSDYGTCDIVHMFEPFLTTYAPWLRLGAGKGTPACWFDWADLWAQGGLLGHRYRRGIQDRWEYFWANRIEQRAPRIAAGMTVCSKWLADEALKRGAKKAVLVHHGVWPVTVKPRVETRGKLGLHANRIYLGFMGRTMSPAEFMLCLDALRAVNEKHDVRLAMCGPLEHFIEIVPSDLRGRVDYLGKLTAAECQDFAGALDFALLPLEETPFNLSRYPLKFSDYLSAGARVIISDVGECAQLAKTIEGVVIAKKGRDEWISTVTRAVDSLVMGEVLPVDQSRVDSLLSWDSIGSRVWQAYTEN